MEEGMDLLVKMLPIIIPLGVVQLVLMVVALVHVIKNPKCKVGNQVLWVIVILLVNIIGPILYFIIGKGEGEEE